MRRKIAPTYYNNDQTFHITNGNTIRSQAIGPTYVYTNVIVLMYTFAMQMISLLAACGHRVITFTNDTINQPLVETIEETIILQSV